MAGHPVCGPLRLQIGSCIALVLAVSVLDIPLAQILVRRVLDQLLYQARLPLVSLRLEGFRVEAFPPGLLNSPRLFIRYTWSSISSNIAWLSGCSIHSIIGFAIVLYLLLAFLLRLGNLFTAVPQVLNVVVNFRRRRFGENRLRLLDNRAAPSRVRCAGPNFMGSAGQTAPGDRRVVSAQGLSSETSQSNHSPKPASAAKPTSALFKAR